MLILLKQPHHSSQFYKFTKRGFRPPFVLCKGFIHVGIHATSFVTRVRVPFFIWEKFSPKIVEKFENNLLIILMALLTIVAFSQVIARYGFNTGWSGALEFSMVLFSWLILIGMSYGIKRSSHLGVDILLKATPKQSLNG